MKDYTIPPTEEFERHKTHMDFLWNWMILQKAVMNDYYFDAPNQEWIREDLDNFIHKIYYCWQEASRHIFMEEEE